ncbi:Trp operon repressor [Chryseoglobus frigidaquae]|uniref:Trp operon repressor n=2 Tax=Microcella frigidaquae TaxID=424758 RepID=A0A840X4U4_9MICO|nr:Trp operon repressor [Microcella frigidaquae]NHN45392.1 transposase [Microcella frigidaquae]
MEDVAYRVIAVNETPDHATLARFRARHQDAIAGLFSQVLGLCVNAGLVDAGLVAIDGTKIEADASYFANRTRDELAAQVLAEAAATDAAEDDLLGDRAGSELPDDWAGGQGRRERIRAALAELEGQPARDYEARLAERAAKEAATGKGLTGPKPRPDTANRPGPRKANTTDPHSRIIATGGSGVMQGYNAQTAATTQQIVVAAEVTATTNDQPHFVPIAMAVSENLAEAGAGKVGTFVADAGYWTGANGTADVGAEVLIATRKPPWRQAERPDDHKITILAKVNRGELSQRQAGDILGVSYTWVRDMTKRYFGKDGPRQARTAQPEPDEWIPVIERLARGEISKRAATDELQVSAGRVNTMLAHVRGEAVDPEIARHAMDAKLATEAGTDAYRKRQHSIEPVFGNVKGNLGYRRFTRRGMTAVHAEWRLICSVHNLLKLRTATTA